MRLNRLAFLLGLLPMISGCADTPQSTEPFIARADAITPRLQLTDPAVADDFESATIDPFWNVEQNFGTVALTTAQSKSGTQSVSFASASGGQRGLGLHHQFQSAMKGRFAIYFYDAAPGQETLYESISLRSSSNSEIAASIGTQDFDAFCYTVSLFDNGNLQGPNANCGIYPQVTTTSTPRTSGWHLFEILVGATTVSFAIDGATVFVANGDYSFDIVNVGITGPFWRPNTTAYFDDFTYMPLEPVNAAPTAEPGSNTAGGGYSGLEGSPLSFNGTGSSDPNGDLLTFAWDFGDSGTASGATPVHTYADNGSLTATLTVSDGRGGTDTKSTNVTVSNVAPTVTNFSAPTLVQFAGGPVTAQITNVQFTDPAGALDAPYLTSIDCGNLTVATAQGVCTYSAPGLYTIAVRVSDKDGGVSSSRTAAIRVGFSFSGFFQPVDNVPVVNVTKAGSAIPMKFSLGGNFGLNIMSAGFPASGQATCDASAPADDIESTVSAGTSGLQYDASTATYTYVWKTEKGWAGTCRQFVLKLSDGTEHRAVFRLK